MSYVRMLYASSKMWWQNADKSDVLLRGSVTRDMRQIGGRSQRVEDASVQRQVLAGRRRAVYTQWVALFPISVDQRGRSGF